MKQTPATNKDDATEPKLLRRGFIAAAAAMFAGFVMKQTSHPAEAAGGMLYADTGTTVTNTSTAPTVIIANDASGAYSGTGSVFTGQTITSSAMCGIQGVLGLRGPAPLKCGVFGDTGEAGTSVGVIGNSQSGANSKGVFGRASNGTGVHGASTSGVGLRGTSSSFVGLVGISDYSIGLYGYTTAPDMPAFYAESLASSGRIAGKFLGDVIVQGNFTVSGGNKSAAVPMPDGSEALVYCQESPEPYFEDFGRGRLVNGAAHVQLEAEFASIVRRDDYMVFITPGGECNTLFVSQQTPNGFDVKEAGGGRSNVPLAYRIVARRKDVEGKRLARLDPRLKANIAALRSAAAAKNHPSMKVPPAGNPLVPLEPIP